MRTCGQHWLVEYHGCDDAVLDDLSSITAILRRAAEAAHARVVGEAFHRFTPSGVSGALLLEESHLSIHTWPEEGYAAVDFYTCGGCVPARAHELIRDALHASHAEVMTVHRGTPGGQAGTAERTMHVHAHHEESATLDRDRQTE